MESRRVFKYEFIRENTELQIIRNINRDFHSYFITLQRLSNFSANLVVVKFTLTNVQRGALETKAHNEH